MCEHFDLGGLLEHVEGGDALQRKTRPEIGQVPGQSRRIARDVKQRRNRMATQDFPHVGAETRRGWVDDHSRAHAIGVSQLLCELRRDFAGPISFCLGRVRLRGGDGVDVPIQADDTRKFCEQTFAEKSGAALRFDQE